MLKRQVPHHPDYIKDNNLGHCITVVWCIYNAQKMQVLQHGILTKLKNIILTPFLKNLLNFVELFFISILTHSYLEKVATLFWNGGST
jgi:hypothetical protein